MTFVTSDNLEYGRLVLALALVAANVAVWSGVYFEGDRFAESTKKIGWRILVIALAAEAAFAAVLVVVDSEISGQQKAEIAELNLTLVQLQKEVAWRTIDEKQVTILRTALAGRNVQGHLMVLNATDPEQVRFVSKIVDLCSKIPDTGCQVHLSNWQASASFHEFPYKFTGVMWFATDDAPDSQKLFVQAFVDAGIATQKMGLMFAWKFSPEIKAGILVMAKPDPIEDFSWVKQPAQP